MLYTRTKSQEEGENVCLGPRGRVCVATVTRAAHLVGEVAPIHLVAVGLASRTLDLNAMALQDGCFFKNTNLIIVYRPRARRHPIINKFFTYDG